MLLAQSAYSLFSAGSAETEGIDIIVRTSAAGVFGHLLSGGGRCPQEPRDPSESRALRFRALAAAAIGIFCLFTLLAYRAVLLHHRVLACGSPEAVLGGEAFAALFPDVAGRGRR